VQRAAAAVTDVARTTLGEVDRTFFRLVAADRRSELTREILTLNERLADVSRRQLKSGEIIKIEFNLAVVEFGRARARLLAASRERSETAHELRQLLGFASMIAVLPVADTADQPIIAARLVWPLARAVRVRTFDEARRAV